jgi:hypothetical protein
MMGPELRRFEQWAGNPKGVSEDETRCRGEVWPTSGLWIPYQCLRKRGHGLNGWFCKQHAKRYPHKKEAVE